MTEVFRPVPTPLAIVSVTTFGDNRHGLHVDWRFVLSTWGAGESHKRAPYLARLLYPVKVRRDAE